MVLSVPLAFPAEEVRPSRSLQQDFLLLLHSLSSCFVVHSVEVHQLASENIDRFTYAADFVVPCVVNLAIQVPVRKVSQYIDCSSKGRNLLRKIKTTYPRVLEA